MKMLTLIVALLFLTTSFQQESPELKEAAALDRLGLQYLRDNNLGKAEETYKRAIALKEKSLGPDDPQLAQSLEGLATVYRARRDVDRGVPVYKRAITIYAQTSGVNSLAFQQASRGFACLAFENEKRERVKELNEIWKRFAPPDGPSEAPDANLLNTKAKKLPPPSYPPKARALFLSGTVVMKATIDEKGDVIAIRDMCQGPPFLTEAAIDAARNARFEPPMVAGRPAKVDGVIIYRFVAR